MAPALPSGPTVPGAFGSHRDVGQGWHLSVWSCHRRCSADLHAENVRVSSSLIGVPRKAIAGTTRLFMAGLRQFVQAARGGLAALEANSPSVSRFAKRFAGRCDADPIVVRGSVLIWGLGGAMAAFVLSWAGLSDFHVDGPKMTALVALSATVAIGAFWVRRHLGLQVQPMLVEAYTQFFFIS